MEDGKDEEEPDRAKESGESQAGDVDDDDTTEFGTLTEPSGDGSKPIIALIEVR